MNQIEIRELKSTINDMIISLERLNGIFEQVEEISANLKILISNVRNRKRKE